MIPLKQLSLTFRTISSMLIYKFQAATLHSVNLRFHWNFTYLCKLYVSAVFTNVYHVTSVSVYDIGRAVINCHLMKVITKGSIFILVLWHMRSFYICLALTQDWTWSYEGVWRLTSFSLSTDVTSTDLVSAKGKTKEVYCCDIVVLMFLMREGLQCRISILKYCLMRLWNDINQLTSVFPFAETRSLWRAVYPVIIIIIIIIYTVATNLEKSGNLNVVREKVRENRKSQGKCVLAFGVPAITPYNGITIAYVPQIGDFVPQ